MIVYADGAVENITKEALDPASTTDPSTGAVTYN